MDATSPLARGNPLPAEEAAALTPALPGGNLPWKPLATDGRGAPAGAEADPTAAVPATEAEAAANPPSLVAAFKQALAGPAPAPAPRFPSGPAGEANVTSAGLPVAPATTSAPPPRPDSLYSQMAAAFTAPASTNASAPAAVPVKTGSVPAPEGTPNNPFAASSTPGTASPAAAGAVALAPTAPPPSDANLTPLPRTSRSAPSQSPAPRSVEPPAEYEASSPTLPAHGPTPAPAATPLTTVVSPRLNRVSPGTELGEASDQPAATAVPSRTTPDHPRVIAAPTVTPASAPAAITKAPTAPAAPASSSETPNTGLPAATTVPVAANRSEKSAPPTFPPAPDSAPSLATPPRSSASGAEPLPALERDTPPVATAQRQTEKQGSTATQPVIGAAISAQAPAATATTPAALTEAGEPSPQSVTAAPQPSIPATLPRASAKGNEPESSPIKDAPSAFTAGSRADPGERTPLPASARAGTLLATTPAPAAAASSDEVTLPALPAPRTTPAAADRSSDVPPGTSRATPASLPLTSGVTPRPSAPKSEELPSLTRDAAPAFTAQPRADEGSRAFLPRPTSPATPLPASPAAPTAPATLASRGDLPLPAFPVTPTSVPVTTASQPRPSATDSDPQPTLTADARPGFSGQSHSDQGIRTPVPAVAVQEISATAPAGAPIAPASTSTRGEVARPAAALVTTTPVTASPSGEVSNPPSVAPARPSATDPGQPSSPRDNASPAFTGQPEADEGGRASLPRSAPAAAPTVFAGPAPRGEAPLVALPVAPAPVIAIPATGSRPRAGDSESSGPRAEDAPPAFTAPARDEDGSPPASRTPAGQAPHAPVSATTPQPPASVAPSAEAPLAPGEPVPFWSTPAAQPRRNASETGVQTSPQGDALPVDPLPSSADPVLRPSPATAVATVLQSPVGLPHPAEASAPAKPAAPFASGNPPSSGLPVASASAPARPTAEPRPRATVSDPQSAPRGTTESASIPPTRADRGDEAARPKSVGATPANADTSAPSREVPVAAFPAASASVTARVSAQPRPEASKSEQPPTANGDARAAFTGQPRPDQSKRDPLPSLATVASPTPFSAEPPPAPAAVAQRVADTLPVFGATPTQAPVLTADPIRPRPSATQVNAQPAPNEDAPPAFSGRPRSEPGEWRPFPAAVPSPIASQVSTAAPNTPAASAPRGDVPVSALPVVPAAVPARDAAVAPSGVIVSAPQPTRTDDARSDFTGQPRAGQSNREPLPSPAAAGSQPPVSAVAPQVPALVARSSDTPRPGVAAAQAPAPATNASQQRPSAIQPNAQPTRTDDTTPALSGQSRPKEGNPMPLPAAVPTPVASQASTAAPTTPAASAPDSEAQNPAFPVALASVPARVTAVPYSSVIATAPLPALPGDARSAFTGQPRSKEGNPMPLPAASSTPVASQAPSTATTASAALAPARGESRAVLPIAPDSAPVSATTQVRPEVSDSASPRAVLSDARALFTGQPRDGQGQREPVPSSAPIGTGSPVSAATRPVPAIVARSSDAAPSTFPVAEAKAPADSAAQQDKAGTDLPARPTRTADAPTFPEGQPSDEGALPTPTRTPASLAAATAQPDLDHGQAPGNPAPAVPAATVSAAPVGVPRVAPRTETGDLPASAPASSTGTLAATPARTEQNETKPGAPTAESPGDAVLRSLSFQAFGLPVPPPAATVPSAAPVSPAERVAALQAAIAETVSRVLVSDPLHDGRREVRIEFAADVLPDTSVRLWRHEGRLQIEFISTGAVADAGLRDGLPRLVEALQRQNPQAGLTEISLRLSDSSGQPGDGRSRQRYQAEEENGAQV